MRKKNGHKKTIFWLILLVLVFLVVVYFRGALGPRQQNEQQATALAEKYAHITKKTDYYEYQRENSSYHTIVGQNKQGEKLYAVVSNNNRKINVLSADKGISAKQAQDAVVSKRKPKKVLNVALGMDKKGKKPLWEVTYLNQKGNLCYTLLSFKDGVVTKEIQNL